MSFLTCVRPSFVPGTRSAASSRPPLRPSGRRRPPDVGDANRRLNGLLGRYRGVRLVEQRVLAFWLALRIVTLAHITNRTAERAIVNFCRVVDPLFAQMLTSPAHRLRRSWAEFDSFTFEALGLAMNVDAISPRFEGQVFRNSDAVARALSTELESVRSGRPAGVVRTAAGPAGGGAGKPPQIEASFEIQKRNSRPLLLAIDGKRGHVSSVQVHKLSADCSAAHDFANRAYTRVQGVLVVAGGAISPATFVEAADRGIIAVEITGVFFNRSGRVA